MRTRDLRKGLLLLIGITTAVAWSLWSGRGSGPTTMAEECRIVTAFGSGTFDDCSAVAREYGLPSAPDCSHYDGVVVRITIDPCDDPAPTQFQGTVFLLAPSGASTFPIDLTLTGGVFVWESECQLSVPTQIVLAPNSQYEFKAMVQIACCDCGASPTATPPPCLGYKPENCPDMYCPFGYTAACECCSPSQAPSP